MRSRWKLGALGLALVCLLGAGPGAGPVILCLGDSLTEGYGVEPEQAFPSLLEARLRANGHPGARVINAGISGSTSASAAQRLRWQLRSRPDVLVLALGANDGLRGVDLAATRKHLGQAIAYARTNKITPPWTAREEAEAKKAAEAKGDKKP